MFNMNRWMEFIPAQMLYEELQCFVIGRRQLPQQIFHLEEDAAELHADLVRFHGAGAEAQRL